MSVRIEHMKEAEERIKASLASTLASTLTVGVVMILVVIFGLVCAGRW
jgi:hypothetical protein